LVCSPSANDRLRAGRGLVAACSHFSSSAVYIRPAWVTGLTCAGLKGLQPIYNYFRDYDAVTGRYLQSDPIGLLGGTGTYSYAGGNPNGSIDPFGLDALSLGQGYTGRIDLFNYGGQSSFEIHVYNNSGREVGIYGPKGWIAKHGFSDARPPGLPVEVVNTCRGIAVDKLRASGQLPPKGTANIKGSRLVKFLRLWGLFAVAEQELKPSNDHACELDPTRDNCYPE